MTSGPHEPPTTPGHEPPTAARHEPRAMAPPDAGHAAAAMADALAALTEPPSAQGEPFLSDLSVGELVLLDEVGYDPVDLVMGAGSASWSPQSITVPPGGDAWAWGLTHALTHARQGIERELAAHHADGVVAVQLALHRHPANLLTCTMLGTAVRRRKGTARPAHHPTHPFSTTLSAADFHLLVRAGYVPAGMVVGAAVVGFPSRTVSQGLGLSRQNAELVDQTAALYTAREQAMARLDADARGLGADGVVAVSFTERPFATMLVHAVELLVVGTAVRRGPDGHRPLDPHLQLGLDDPLPDVFQRG